MITAYSTLKMANQESIATSTLESIGCWTESSGGHTTRDTFDDCINPSYDDLRHLAALPCLKRVCFYGTPVDGNLLSSLTCDQTLTSLNLNCTSITQSDVKIIARFPKLEHVGLMGTPADDDCLESLLSCPEITNLRIDGTNITPDGTVRLVKKLDLNTFWIGGNQLSTESLTAISKLAGLREFNVCGESVVDAHIELLLTFPKPECLFIKNTCISNSGLERLAHVYPNASNVE